MLGYKVNTLFSMSGILYCLTVHTGTQQFSQNFLNTVTQKRSIVKSNSRKIHPYRIGSRLITVVSVAYVLYMFNALYTDTYSSTFRKVYLPTWVHRYSDAVTILIGSIGIGIQVLLYKTIAQIMLALTTCSVKENFDYLLMKNYT